MLTTTLICCFIIGTLFDAVVCVDIQTYVSSTHYIITSLLHTGHVKVYNYLLLNYRYNYHK